MAYTQADLDTLSAAITSGVQEVVYADGRRVRYQTLADMLSLRNVMKLEVSAASADTAVSRRTTIGRIVRR